MRTTVVIIGAGHSGLAMSRQLADRGIDHVVLERGEVANSWRRERWDSLRLLTPNWLTRLPGQGYDGDDPDGFMTVPELVGFLDDYAARTAPPLRLGTTVTRVAPTEGGFAVETDQGAWQARAVVLASGPSNAPSLPAVAEGLPAGIASVTTHDYRSPDQLPDGGVLVVGASASGVQLADELARSGRRVVVSTGEHVRMPRSYRGRDVFWWMDAAGVLDERWDEVDIIRARHTPSPQLIGTPERRDIDLAAVQAAGVEVVGRLGMLRDGVALFSGGLANAVKLADLKLTRLLDRFDAWAEETGQAGLDGPRRPEPTPVDESRLQLDLAREGISSVLWATGYQPDHSWVDAPVFGYRGRLDHEGGVVRGVEGMVVLGSSLLRRRRSTYVSGAEADTRELAEHLEAHLAGQAAPVGRGLLD